MLDLFKKGNYVDNPYNNFYEIKARDFDKNIIQMKNYQKKVLLIVNISPYDKNFKNEFESLQKLKENLGENFEILAFPSSELENIYISDREMREEILKKDFVDNQKINIFNRVYLNGNEISEVFKFCLRNSNFFRMREGTAKPITNNFVKFLIDKKGKIYSQYLPDDENVENQIFEDARKLLFNDDNIKDIKIREDFINYDKYI